MAKKRAQKKDEVKGQEHLFYTYKYGLNNDIK